MMRRRPVQRLTLPGHLFHFPERIVAGKGGPLPRNIAARQAFHQHRHRRVKVKHHPVLAHERAVIRRQHHAAAHGDYPARRRNRLRQGAGLAFPKTRPAFPRHDIPHALPGGSRYEGVGILKPTAEDMRQNPAHGAFAAAPQACQKYACAFRPHVITFAPMK
jgi:hypothetical protein